MTEMSVKQAAQSLDGSEYGREGSRELFAVMKAAGLVAVFGASDDLMEFRGAINDEVGAYDGGTAYLTSDGLLVNECDNDACPYFARMKETAAMVTMARNFNIPPDVLDLLVNGDVSRGVPPGALLAGIKAAE